MIVYFYLYYTHITLHLHLKCFRRLRLPLLSWKRHVVVSMPSFRDHKPRRGAPASAEGFLLLMFFWFCLGWKSYLFRSGVGGFGRIWWWKLECCRLMKAAGDSLGTCFCHGNTMLRRRGLSLTRAVTNSLVASHWGLLLSKIYPVQWNVTTVSNTAHPAWMPCTRLGRGQGLCTWCGTCHAAAEGAPTGSSHLKDSRGIPIW